VNRRDVLRYGWGTAVLAITPLPVCFAQTKYPERPIRLVVPFAPGGSTDVLSRKLAAKLGPLLGESIVVDNKSGAAGAIGASEVARARPDGYTLLMGTTSTHALNPLIMANPSYDAIKDFSAIAMLGTQAMSIAVNPTLPVRSLAELVTLLRANPGKYSYGSSGAGGIAHLAGELFKLKAGNLDMVHIPYKGGGPAMQDVIAGHIPIISDSFSSTYAQHRTGRLRVLAMTGEKRSPAAPEIPTAVEAGVAGVVASTAGILLAPARTPQPLIHMLDQAMQKVMADDSFLKDLEALSIEPAIDYGPEKTTAYIKSEISKWAPVVEAARARIG